jgi:hypothetical protein
LRGPNWKSSLKPSGLRKQAQDCTVGTLSGGKMAGLFTPSDITVDFWIGSDYNGFCQRKMAQAL